MGYRAFFSYARADDKVANWLHRQLDTYRTPKALVGGESVLGLVPTKLHPIFRDRTDLQAGGHIDQSLQKALEDSDTLVVLCTPTSAKSIWVNHECETFLKLGRGDRIFPVIAGGEPDSADPETECFPPALRGKGLLAADLRDFKKPGGQLVGDGREGGRLKLIAGLLGVPLDALAQRERRRQRTQRGALGVAALTFAGVAAVAIFFWQAAQRNLEQVNAALADIYVQSAWSRIATDDMPAAARYALSGMRIPSGARTDLDLALGRVLWGAGDSVEVRNHVRPAALDFTGRVSAASFDASSERVVTIDEGGTATIRTVLDGREQLQLRASGQDLQGAIFSPAGDFVVTFGVDGAARTWRASDGQRLQEFRGAGGAITSVALSDDGRMMALVEGWDQGATVCAVSGRCLFSLGRGTTQYEGADFSPDGALVVLPTLTGPVEIWSVAERRRLRVLPHDRGTEAARFLGDGSALLTLSFGRARIWDTSTGRLRADFPDENILDFAANPRRNEIAWATPQGVSVVDWQSGVVTKRLAHEERVTAVAYSADGVRVVSAGDDFIVRVWEVQSGALVNAMRGHNSSIESVAFSPDGSAIISSDASYTARIWRNFGGNRVFSAQPSQKRTVMTFSPDERMLAFGYEDGAIETWSIGERRRISHALVHATAINSIDVEQGGESVVTSSNDRLARIVALETLEVRSTLDGGPAPDHAEYAATSFEGGFDPAAEVTSAHFSPDGRLVATAHRAHVARLWSVIDGRLVATLEGTDAGVLDVAFSRDGTLVATAAGDGALRLYDVRSGTQAMTIQSAADPDNFHGTFSPETINALSVAFAPDGRSIAAGLSDGTARIWSLDEGGEQRALLRGHSGVVQSIAFSANSNLVATGGYDGTVRLWNAMNGREVLKLDTDGPVQSVQFSRSGRLLGFSTEHGTVEVWDASVFLRERRDLTTAACTNVLTASNRTFSLVEQGADPLIQRLWLRGRRDRDVCEGVLD